LPPIIKISTPLAEPLQQVFPCVYPISKLYTDDTGRFPILARSSNQYVMIVHHIDGNLILQQAFQTKTNKHRIPAFNTIMERLAACGLLVDLNREICPKTIPSLLCKLMENHQTCSTPITSPKWKKMLHPMTSPIKCNPVTSPKKHIIQRHHFNDLSCICLSQSYF
jgi:hypothetical protein